MGKLILILGGARSGKSTFAQEMAHRLGEKRVLFVATAEAGDEEMRRRIEKHQRERPAGWRTLEASRNVGAAIRKHANDAEVVLLDCLTLLVSNLLGEAEDPFSKATETQVMGEMRELLECVKLLPIQLIVVTNEVGMGLVPPYPLGRAYRDLMGQANRALALEADEAYLMVAGIPMSMKPAA